MNFRSKRRFHDEVERRVCEEIKKHEEHRWRDEREREQNKRMRELENRLIRVEKALQIDHPSHYTVESEAVF